MNLTKRVILSINTALVICLSLISVLAMINRKNTQYRDAEKLLSNEITHASTLLDINGSNNLDAIKEVFYNKKIYNTGYLSLISKNGDVIIDPFREKQNISALPYFKDLSISNKLNRIEYKDQSFDQRKYLYYQYYQPLDAYITATIDHKELITKPVLNTLKILLFALIFASSIFSLVNYIIIGSISRPIKHLVKLIKDLSQGKLPEKSPYNQKDEVGQMATSINELIDGLKLTAVFAEEIGHSHYDHHFKPLSDDDVLGNSLIRMRDDLKKASEEEKIRKEEDDKRNWTTHGLARFADILRQNHESIEALSYNIISKLVEYLKINQGGIFVLNENSNANEQYLELTGCYAFDRRKFLEKKILPGEGLVGTCFLEQETIYLTQIPQNYIRITSGLGDDNPSSLLIVPLKINDEIYGVIELASFKPFEAYQIEFIEKIGESIASTISGVKVNSRTKFLLEQSQMQAEQMKSQEEEMRQNMEELSATQEAMAEKDREQTYLIDNLTKENEIKLKTIAQKEKQLQLILEECPECVISTDENGIIELFNKSSEKLFGYNRNEVMGKKINLLMSDFHAGNHDTYMENYLNTGIKKVMGKGREVEIKTKSGEITSAYLTLTEAIIDNHHSFIGFLKDLTEIKNLQKPLKENDTEAPVTPHISPDPYIGQDEDIQIAEIHKGEPTENQEKWAEHLVNAEKKFKKSKKK